MTKQLIFTIGCASLMLLQCARPSAPATTTTSPTAPAEKMTTASAGQADYSNGLQLGEKAADFQLKNIDGKTYSLADVKDAKGRAPKGYVVTFTCNTCPFAVGYEDRLVALHNKVSALGYPLVAIQPNDPEVKPGDGMEAMQQRAKDKGFGFLYLLDEGQRVYPQYGASRTPEVYLLDNKGILRYHGAIDDSAQDASAVTVNYVEKAIAALEAGQNPDPADVKAIGCSIKTR